MKVSIIIVNYNTGDVLKNCIDSIYKYEKNISFEIIVIDNCSTINQDQFVNAVLSTYSGIKTIFLKGKKSFSYANNVGFDNSSGEFTLILNPDIIFLGPVLEKLIQIMNKDKSIGAVCPLLVGNDGIFQRNYFQRYPSTIQFILFYSIISKLFLKSNYLLNKYLENHLIEKGNGKIVYVEQIPCAFLLTSSDIFEKVGKMNEHYELFFEDVDICYRINKKYKLAVDTSVRIEHLGGTSFKENDNWWMYGRFIMSMIRFFNENYGVSKTLTLKLITYLNSKIILLIEIFKKFVNREDKYRIKKHRYFLEEFKKL